MDADNVDAAVFYPTPRLSKYLAAVQDPEFHLALITAYNDWLAEFCSTNPARLGGLMLLPNRGVEQAIEELHRGLSLPGIIAPTLLCYPHGTLEILPEDDALWREVADAGVPLNIHVSLSNSMPGDMHGAGTEGKFASDLRFVNAPVHMLEFLWAGVFDRVPELNVVIAEVDAGWLPYVKEQVDSRYLRAKQLEMPLNGLPSDYIDRHFYWTYITDSYGVRNRQDVGIDRMTWSSDFPHRATHWPRSWQFIMADFAGVPRAERDLIVAGNAMRIYKFGG
jgi:predicted TIM-barrel fold metal-dependent hydrolase